MNPGPCQSLLAHRATSRGPRCMTLAIRYTRRFPTPTPGWEPSVKGRVTVYTGQPRTLSQSEYDVPDPEPGAIVVRMRQAGLCGSDLHIWRGDLGGTPPTGRPLGHEGFGTIHALGKGVERDFDGQPLLEGD